MELSVTQILQLLCTSGHFHDCCREFEQCRRNLNPRGDGDDDEGDDDEDDDDDDDNDDDGDGGGDDDDDDPRLLNIVETWSADFLIFKNF